MSAREWAFESSGLFEASCSVGLSRIPVAHSTGSIWRNELYQDQLMAVAASRTAPSAIRCSGRLCLGVGPVSDWRNCLRGTTP